MSQRHTGCFVPVTMEWTHVILSQSLSTWPVSIHVRVWVFGQTNKLRMSGRHISLNPIYYKFRSKSCYLINSFLSGPFGFEFFLMGLPEAGGTMLTTWRVFVGWLVFTRKTFVKAGLQYRQMLQHAVPSAVSAVSLFLSWLHRYPLENS